MARLPGTGGRPQGIPRSPSVYGGLGHKERESHNMIGTHTYCGHPAARGALSRRAFLAGHSRTSGSSSRCSRVNDLLSGPPVVGHFQPVNSS